MPSKKLLPAEEMPVMEIVKLQNLLCKFIKVYGYRATLHLVLAMLLTEA